jgi:hypothetical protein
MGVGGQLHASAALPPVKTRYPLYRRLGGPVWTGAENLAPTGIRSPDRPARRVAPNVYDSSVRNFSHVTFFGSFNFEADPGV